MSDQDTLMRQAEAWLAPLSGDDGPCGPDLEYDNAFHELFKAADGKPETQFEKGVPPDWRLVRSQAEDLLGRTRDLRVALLWLRAVVNLEGLSAVAPGLKLVTGLLQTHWDTLHPLPDPSDNDAFARANALAMLPQHEGGLGDLMNARLVQIKGLGDIRLREIEVSMGTFDARSGEPSYSRDQMERMLVAADQEGAGLRPMLLQAQQSLKALSALMDERFGAGTGSDHKPLADLLAHALAMVPEANAETVAEAGVDGAAGAPSAGGAGPSSSKAGLSGSVNSRAEAVRAIELVCAYLERHEPTNPAQLFLRRASGLLERNFLELLKELAPNALDDVARIVGVDPSSVGESGQ